MYTLNNIYKCDSIELIRDIDDSSIDLIVSDIPYGIGVDNWDVLHNNTNNAYLGTSPAQEKAGAVFKKRKKPLNGLQKNYFLDIFIFLIKEPFSLLAGTTFHILASRHFHPTPARRVPVSP
jgi:DNA modification methylase